LTITKKWTEKQSRGGLLFPTSDFYLLVREFDCVYRKVVETSPLHWSITSSNKLILLSEMFDSFMVKFYWNKILSRTHMTEQRSLPVLDYLINLFITIKGFSVARKEKNRLTKKVANKFKKSKSMRGNLKSCSGFKK
jgi:hypothetical protein